MTHLNPRRAGARAARTALALVLVGLAALMGAWRVAAMTDTRTRPTEFTLGHVTYGVTHAEAVNGLSARDLSGMSHGIQGLVADDKAIIRVSLVLHADSSGGSFDPGTLRLLAGGSNGQVAPVGGSLAPGHLRPNSTIEGAVAFVVPRSGAALSLAAPSHGHDIPLLTVDRAPTGAGASGHDHHADPPATTGTATPR
ncbi:MAG: hypothetical protein WB473_08225 [Pedococcus sp.]